MPQNLKHAAAASWLRYTLPAGRLTGLSAAVAVLFRHIFRVAPGILKSRSHGTYTPYAATP